MNPQQFIIGLLFSFFFFQSCQQNKNEIILKKQNRKAKQRKSSSVHKKGIEHIADYQKEIRKGINQEKSSYKDGYLFKEYQLAKQKAQARRGSNPIITPVFKERGPNNVPGRSRGLAIDPNNPNRWYVGTVGGGVWLTENAGISWSSLTDFKIPNLSTSTIVMSQTNSNILYVGTGEPFGNLGAIGGSGVFKTINGGTTWQHLTATSNFGDIGRMIINPSDHNNILVGATSGIYRTTDGGVSWAKTYASPGWVQDLDADPSNFNIQYGSIKGLGVVKSIDGGLNWNVIFNKENFNTNHSRFETAVSPANSNIIFLSVYSSASGATVGVNTDFYISRNQGASFRNLTTTDANANLLTGQGWYDNVLMAHPFDANVFYVGGVAVFKGTVSGTTYTATSIASGYDSSEINSNVHVDQHGLFYVLGTNNAFKIILTNDGGVYTTASKQDPGITEGDWSNAVIGKNSTQFYGAAKQNGADNYLAGAQDNGSWVSLGGDSTKDKEYTSIFGGDGFEVIWHYNNPGDLIVTSQNNYIGRYVDYGFESQTQLEGSQIFYTKVSNADNNPNVVFSVVKEGVWRSEDFAKTWKLTPISSFSSGEYSSLNVKVSTADPNVVWAGAEMNENGSYLLHVSQDNGQSFEKTGIYDNPNGNHYFLISGLATSYIEKNRAYALFSAQGSPKILKTENLGATWQDISGFEAGIDTGFPDVAVHSLLEMPFDSNIIWAGTDIGIFQTENGGTSWSLITDFPAVAVYDMKVVNDQVVIASYGRGIWSATISELSTYVLPTYLASAEFSTQQKEIESQKTMVSYSVPTDEISRVKLYVNGVEETEISQDFEKGILYTYELQDLPEGYHQLGIKVFDDTNNLETVIKSQEFLVIDFDTPTTFIDIAEFTSTDVFTYKSDFVIDNIGGDLSTQVLNNVDHRYKDNTTYSAILKKPLLLSELNKDFSYEDLAIVEPYEASPPHNLELFYDYVLLEASTDLNTWKTLDKYDARRFSDWLAAYNAGLTTVNDNLFKRQSITLTDKGFSIGDTLVIRFRLVTDQSENSFGWAIKSINAGATASVDDVLANTKAFTIFPTISEGNMTLFGNRDLGKVNLTIFDLRGQKVYASDLDFNILQEYEIALKVSAGIYLVNLTDEKRQTSTQKIVIE